MHLRWSIDLPWLVSSHVRSEKLNHSIRNSHVVQKEEKESSDKKQILHWKPKIASSFGSFGAEEELLPVNCQLTDNGYTFDFLMQGSDSILSVVTKPINFLDWTTRNKWMHMLIDRKGKPIPIVCHLSGDFYLIQL